ECRRDDVAVRSLLQPLDDLATHRAVRAERAALAELEGGCVIPMAAWARDLEGPEDQAGSLALAAAVYALDGRARAAPAPAVPREDRDDLGRRVARALRDQGAEALLKRV